MKDISKLRFRKFAVIGDPVQHSLSPAMHNAAFRFLGIEAVYEAVHVKALELAKFAEKARNFYDGFNVTVPHKGSIIPYLDEITSAAKFAESVNTVINEGGKLFGDSTDGRGLEMAIKNEFGLSVSGKKIFFIGCGGACRAVAIHFASIGAKKIYFVNRTLQKADALCRLISQEFPSLETEYSSYEDISFLEKAVNDSLIIIQSTRIGLKEGEKSLLDEKFFIKGKVYYDMIYKETHFLQLAKKHGCQCAGGLSMLIYQGIESFKLWTSITPPVEVMKRTVQEAKKNIS